MVQMIHPKHGPGASVSFSTYLCDIGTNGVTAEDDYRLPFELTTLFDAGLASGIISADGNHTTGLTMHPDAFGARMNRETFNYSRYLWKWIRITYVPSCATSEKGNLTLAFTRDPTSFMEASGTQSAPTMSLPNLSQSIPLGTTGVWSGMNITCMNREDSDLLFTEVVAGGGTYSYGNNLETLAYRRSAYFGRLAGLLTGTDTGSVLRFGQLWISGVIEFYNPVGTFLSIGTTIDEGGLLRHSKPGLNSVYSTSARRWFVSSSELKDFQSDPFSRSDEKTSREDEKQHTDRAPSKVVSWETDDLEDSPVSIPAGNKNTARKPTQLRGQLSIS
jgi:hypothetical protein